ncbi:MAG: hypothetical protein JO066_08000 [Verrucomicrobia bacterium]|nr:hypothetical protein [Verrucomicrobiota bacterium]
MSVQIIVNRTKGVFSERFATIRSISLLTAEGRYPGQKIQFLIDGFQICVYLGRRAFLRSPMT